MKNRCISIDALRIILAFLVVALHAPFPNAVNWYIEPITRCAVPLFFMISGFVLYSDSAETIVTRVCKQIPYLMKTASLTWLFYFLWRSIIEFAAGKSIFTLVPMSFNATSIMVLALFNKPMVGDYVWYLLALIYVEIIYLALAKKDKQNVIWYTIIPGIAFYLLFGKYSMLFCKTKFEYYIARNFLFDGLPYFSLGNFFAAQKDNIKKINNSILILISLLGYVGVIFEKKMLQFSGVYIESHHYFFSTAIMIGIFAFVINNNGGLFLAQLGKKYSLIIYLIHLYFVDFIEIGLNKIGAIPVAYKYIAPIIVFLLSLGSSILLIAFKQKYCSRKRGKKHE